MDKITKDTWVEIEQVVLNPSQRVPSLPDETRRVPYVLRASGFLMDDANLGDAVQIRTLIGRTLSGTLKTANPSYRHSFGDTVPELLGIGTEREP